MCSRFTSEQEGRIHADQQCFKRHYACRGVGHHTGSIQHLLIFKPSARSSSSLAHFDNSTTPALQPVPRQQAATLAASYSTSVNGANYSGSVEESGGTYTASIPNLARRDREWIERPGRGEQSQHRGSIFWRDSPGSASGLVNRMFASGTESVDGIGESQRRHAVSGSLGHMPIPRRELRPSGHTYKDSERVPMIDLLRVS
jgi:hypothetical protein